MYPEFDKVSFLGMPCPQLFLPEKDSKPVQIEFLLKSTSEFPDERKIPSKDADKDGREEEKDDKERESNASPRSWSSSSCFFQEHGIKGEDILGSKSKGDELKEEVVATNGEQDDDHGYHTPTSPRNRIPVPTKCPPTPKKPTPSLRFKRRRESSQARRHTDVGGHVELLFCSELDYLLPKVKKATGDSPITE